MVTHHETYDCVTDHLLMVPPIPLQSGCKAISTGTASYVGLKLPDFADFVGKLQGLSVCFGFSSECEEWEGLSGVAGGIISPVTDIM